jgi:HK97 family phage prohead protease
VDQIQSAVDAVLPATKFQIFSGLLKASRSQDGKLRLHGVASSTTRDLHGDTMEPTAIEDMERAANNNLTIFLNHSYDVPEDVAGSVERAVMKTRGADQNGDPNYDLDMDILVNDANPRAVKAFEAIERGTKLGLSIGALIPEGGAVRDKKSGTYVIQHVELLETSLVGIPANPRSWVEYAAKSLRLHDKDAFSVPIGQPTLTLDGTNYRIEGSLEGANLNITPATTNSANTITSEYVLLNGLPGATVSDNLLRTSDPDVVDAAQPGCDDCKPGQPCAAHKSVDPDVQDAQVTIIQIDTGDGSSSSDSGSSGDASQEGQTTDPDTGDYAASGDDAATAKGGEITVDIKLEGPVTDTVQQMIDLLRATSGELVDARKQIGDLTRQLSDVTSERDRAVEERDTVLRETKRVLDKVADAPLVRRAVAVEAQRELHSKFAGYLSDDFLKLMES